ncbi:MAG: chromosome segregation protein SMC [Clostridiales bacterium]|nr:chromosome segregation protein SMC [Clostridiales bacterium]
MNFEKVEIYGFKSFADKAEIKFGDGITGIVGPNGCGKSNVADAIRWVLGEQSAKTLRGSSMQDVIFSGTQGRKSLSYCEVSLFFDNSNKMFSIDYNELIITRKLFRSGESEYYINKQPARLRDIVDLLHECGIGKEGYTIIGQGKVEEIMSAKPEDRRMIFEEATGIAKFKTRKNESQRKLERTHENLVRYIDILTEIENQLAPLERQAAKAREFNELSEELKYHELNTYIAKVDGVETAKGKINTRIKGLDEQSALRNEELVKAQGEYDKIFSDITDADTKLNQLHDELLEKRVSMEKSSGAKQLYEQKISYLKSQIERAEKEIESNIALIDECKTSFSSNEDKLKEDTAQLEKLKEKAEKLSKRLLSVSEKIALGEELQDANRKKVIESIETLSDIKLNKGTMSIEKNNLVEKLNELTVKLDELSVKREEQFNNKEKCDKNIDELDRAVFDLKNQIEQKENEVRNGNEEVAKLDNAIYSLNSVITTLVTKDNFYKALKDNYEGYAPAVKNLLNKAKQNGELKRRIKGVVAELIKSDKKFDIALETALAAAAQNVVTATPDDARYLIEYLKVNGLGRITFLPITSVKPREQSVQVTLALKEQGALGVANELVSYDKQYENVISNLLGNTLIVDTLQNATRIADKYRFAFKMVTLDGDVFTTQGAMTGGSRRTDTVGLLSSDRKIEDNAEQLKKKRAEMDSIKAEKVELEKKRDKALDSLTLLGDMYNGKRQQILVEREKQAVAEKSLSELGQSIENTTDLIEDVKVRIEKLDADYQAVHMGGAKLEAERTSATETANKHQAEYDALKKERDQLAGESTEIQVKITELKGSITALNAENTRLSGVITEAENSNKGLKKSNEGAEGIIEELRRDQEKIALTKAEQDYINGIRAKIEDIEKNKSELREKLNRNDEKKQYLTNAITELSEKKHAEEIALAKIDSDLEYLQQSIWEDYQETYETAVKCRAENYDASFGESEINRIRKKRSSLGAINATAIEDSKALKERYEEMTTQKEDLEKAEKDLQEAIDKIKSEMLTQFDEGFTKINENFQRIFKELFGGGRAMLQMDYSEVDDRLEAGVEIVAEPPGKKLQKLSLLSGGEKALTAIAILFAILKLRPMPFCVLDEIEAALDEANVDRFARYLKKFSQDTQFIVITHRKPTMELADALFGVTMQEKGVSKMVSVKLSDVADITGDQTLA